MRPGLLVTWHSVRITLWTACPPSLALLLAVHNALGREVVDSANRKAGISCWGRISKQNELSPVLAGLGQQH
jgi:hypothetical protein